MAGATETCLKRKKKARFIVGISTSNSVTVNSELYDWSDLPTTPCEVATVWIIEARLGLVQHQLAGRAFLGRDSSDQPSGTEHSLLDSLSLGPSLGRVTHVTPA